MNPSTPTPAERGEQALGELQVALGTVGSFQSATQHADSKAGMLVAVHTGLTAFVVSRTSEALPALFDPAQPAWRLVVAVVVLAVFSIAAVVAGLSLLQAVRPRLTPPPEENRFAFPTVASRYAQGLPLRPASMDDMCAEAWSMAGAMAVIALAKHHHVRRAVYGMAAMLVTTVLVVWCLTGR